MPNVRVALAFLLPLHDVLIGCSEKLQGGVMADDPKPGETSPRKELTPAAQRALAEAEARRKAAAENAKLMPKEFQGPKGPEPTRYGDWENKGIASDF
jgi:hypothetical protein